MGPDSTGNITYELPRERIAVMPAERREDARLLTFDRRSRQRSHRYVRDFPNLLRSGDLLILNNVRVTPARVTWKKPTGGHCELLLLHELGSGRNDSRWEALVSGTNLQFKETYDLPGGLSFEILEREEGARTVIAVNASVVQVRTWMERYGLPPLPPYIRKERTRRGLEPSTSDDDQRYQTVFAGEAGAVAAPTAGLHFSAELLEKLSKVGVQVTYVHLSVGWGTFEPVRAEQWKSGELHPEWVVVPQSVAKRILSARSEKRRVIAVGTTVVRSLEWWYGHGAPDNGLSGWCKTFLRPPWKPASVDALMTNFHLPGSSLLALVAACLGEGGAQTVLDLYAEAIDREYRFYSYGDAMLVT